MKNKLLAELATGVFVVGMVGMANAALTTIGTATYKGSDYNLIWDDDNNGNSIIWLDYSNAAAGWAVQTAWATGLDSALIYNIDSAYTVAWDDAAWRLADTVDGKYKYGYDGTTTGGYNITTSELGQLFFEEFGNLGFVATDGTRPQPNYGLQNSEDFDNLIVDWYWSGTEYAIDQNKAWRFTMKYGRQGSVPKVKANNHYGLAVRSADVSAVPVPGAVWLLASGLVGLMGLRKK